VGEGSGSPWSSLTEIERRVLALLVDGADGRRIESELQISRSEVKEHIESLLGKLNVHSRLEAATKAVSAGFPGHVAPRPIRVVIVDDHNLFAEAINAVLSEARIDVAAILESGREAIEYALEHRPDVVLLDLGLSDMSGLVAGRKILESWPEAKLVALTALDDPKAISEATAIGFRGYLLKATPIGGFVGSIEDVAAGKRVFPDRRMSEEVRMPSSTSIRSEGPTVFERFTDKARRVVVLAQEEARMLNHNYIGTEHVLLGLIHEGEGVAAKALESLNISLEVVRWQVEEIIGQGQAAPTGHIPFTPRAKKVLELSFREALQLGHNYIGTEHILLGLIREGEGVAAQVLQKLGADLNRVRQTVIQLLSGYTASAGEGFLTGSEETGWHPTPQGGPRCPSCGRPLEGELRYRKLIATHLDEGEDPMPILMLFCGSCGALLRSFRGDADHPWPQEPGGTFDPQED
jgi:DNA-binding NarL/FixJ family response regulator